MELRWWAPRGTDGSPRDPAPLRELLGNVRFAPLWLLPRLAIGWLWLEMGWSQLGDAVTPLAVVLTLLGIALMLGGLTGIAAFVGGCLSASPQAGEGFPMAALHFSAVIWLVLAWKTAGWIGLDRWLLPALGLPWGGSALFTGRGNWMTLERTMRGERNDAQ